MAEMIRVRPVEGRRIMHAGASGRAIDTECNVESSAYYWRAIQRGDLELVTESEDKEPAEPVKRERAKHVKEG